MDAAGRVFATPVVTLAGEAEWRAAPDYTTSSLLNAPTDGRAARPSWAAPLDVMGTVLVPPAARSI